VELRLAGTVPRLALVIAALALLSLISYQGVKDTVTGYGVDSGELHWTERATKLEPGDGEGWDHLGRLKQWDFTDPDPAQAIAAYRKAVEDDPNSARYWMDLSGAYEAAGDMQQARASLDHAKEVYPLSAEVAWQYGNFLLREQELTKGYAEIRRAVISDPSLLQLAISRVWRSNHDVQQLLNMVLPVDVDAYFQAINYFGSIHEAGAELEVWQRVLQLGKPFELKQTFPFFDSLIAEDRSEEARRAWDEAMTATGMAHADLGGNSVMWNGDFARDFLNGGLDWRLSGVLGVVADFEAAPGGEGVRALRLDFTGATNLELYQPQEFVPVKPNTKYRFHAFMRTESLTTESGVRFSIYDPNHQDKLAVSTDNLTGTVPWADQVIEFETSPVTHFLCVRLFRGQSRMFDNKLSGAVWVANAGLTPMAADAGKAAQ
jgi:tetratricopeptide (TPR) repeat protein